MKNSFRKTAGNFSRFLGGSLLSVLGVSACLPVNADVIENVLLSDAGPYVGTGSDSGWKEYDLRDLDLGDNFAVSFTISSFTSDRVNVALAQSFSDAIRGTSKGYSWFLRRDTSSISQYHSSTKTSGGANDYRNPFIGPGNTPVSAGQELDISMVFNTKDNIVSYYIDDVYYGSYSPDRTLSDPAKFDPYYLRLSSYNGKTEFTDIRVGTAVTFTEAAASGKWADTAVWGSAPTAEGSYRMMDAHTLTLDTAGAKANNLSLCANSAMTITEGADLTLGSTFVVQNDAKLNLAGTLTAGKNANIKTLGVTGKNAALNSTGEIRIGELQMNSGNRLLISGASTVELDSVTGTGTLAIGKDANYTLTVDSPIPEGSVLELAGGKLTADLEGRLNHYYYDSALDGSNNSADDHAGIIADGTRGNVFQNLTPNLSNIISDYEANRPVAEGSMHHGSSAYQNNFAHVWSGYFTPDTTGEYSFWTTSDDWAWVLVDLNQNGIFEKEECISGKTCAVGTAKVNLTAGESYATMFTYTEASGNEYWRFQAGTGTVDANTSKDVLISDNSGSWSLAKSLDYSKVDLSVTDTGSEMELNTPKAAFKSLTMADGSGLTVSGTAQRVEVGTLTSAAAEIDAPGKTLAVSNLELTQEANAESVFALNGDLELMDGAHVFFDLTDSDVEFMDILGDLILSEDVTFQIEGEMGLRRADLMEIHGTLDGNTLSSIAVVSDSLYDVYLGFENGMLYADIGVPEPGTCTLLILGAFGILGLARRNRKSKK